jgi:O-antigen biosynthesis protein
MGKVNRVSVKFKKAAALFAREGLLAVLIRSLQKMETARRRGSEKKKTGITFLAQYDDVLRADWSTNPYVPEKQKVEYPLVVNWVMSPPGVGSGGHQNIFRFIEYLESQNHVCRIYLYSAQNFPSMREIENVLKTSYPRVAATIEWLGKAMEPAHAVFATGWETAYPVFNDPGKARKFYFVQDFEPYFYPVGSEYVLAENTYRFNFYGITAGKWLTHKLSSDYGMECDFYNFGTDTNLYRFENTKHRKEIFFYARPVTARRGFELGILALEIFHEKMPEYTITMAGWDVFEYKIPFPYKNLKSLSLPELSAVYNESAAALVISLTNMSLLPLELLSSGVIPVVTDGPNSTEVIDSPYVRFAHPSPDALAQALIEVVTTDDLPSVAAKAARSVTTFSWQRSGQKFEEILKRELDV